MDHDDCFHVHWAPRHHHVSISRWLDYSFMAYPPFTPITAIIEIGSAIASFLCGAACSFSCAFWLRFPRFHELDMNRAQFWLRRRGGGGGGGGREKGGENFFVSCVLFFFSVFSGVFFVFFRVFFCVRRELGWSKRWRRITSLSIHPQSLACNVALQPELEFQSFFTFWFFLFPRMAVLRFFCREGGKMRNEEGEDIFLARTFRSSVINETFRDFFAAAMNVRCRQRARFWLSETCWGSIFF